MYNQNASPEEKEFYKMLLAEAQNVGNQYLQTCMNPATNQINNFNKWEKWHWKDGSCILGSANKNK